MRFMKLCLLVITMSVGLLLPACQSTPSPKPTVNVTPQAGTAVVTGRLLDITTGRPLANVNARLAQAYIEGDFWVDDQVNSPNINTDNQGYFTILNVPPGTYVVVAGYQESSFGIVEESPDKARIYTFEADKVTDLGDLSISMH